MHSFNFILQLNRYGIVLIDLPVASNLPSRQFQKTGFDISVLEAVLGAESSHHGQLTERQLVPSDILHPWHTVSREAGFATFHHGVADLLFLEIAEMDKRSKEQALRYA